jgi:hypothetical protein
MTANDERDRLFEEIAQRALDIPTLRRQRSGADFYEVAVWTVSEALQQAYDAGRSAAANEAFDACRALHEYAHNIYDAVGPDLGRVVAAARMALGIPPADDGAGPACPCCGERDVDHLIWTDDETVTCQACGLAFNP